MAPLPHVSFSTAVARIEAETPGRASTMTYGDVMLYADIAPVSHAQRQIEYVAQHDALKEWGPDQQHRHECDVACRYANRHRCL